MKFGALKATSPSAESIVGLKKAQADPKGPLPHDCPLPEPAYFEQSQRVASMCFDRPEGMLEWYPPAMIGAVALGRSITADSRYARAAHDLLTILTPDAYSDYTRALLVEGLKRFGPSWGYADLVTVVLGLAEVIKPRNYLEIGVRRGRSVCAVASVVSTCDILMFDMWLANYAGMENPGPDFVLSELKKIGHTGRADFIDGNSHETLPAYFKANPGVAFDMITVDGDHTNLGAAQDLVDVMPHVAVGGAIVFDDICHPKLKGLAEVWRRVVQEDRRFSSWTYTDVGYGVGFAIRKE